MISQFPEFTALTPENRGDYDSIVADLPPYSNLSYPSMRIWNNFDNNLTAARHGDNLVINYSMPYDRDNSGLSVVGPEDVSDSIDVVMGHLEATDQNPRIIHVPEFVIAHVVDIDRYSVEGEPHYDEYMLDTRLLATLEGSSMAKLRNKIGKFNREVDGNAVSIDRLDLTSEATRQEIRDTILGWVNARDSESLEDGSVEGALGYTLENPLELGINAIGLRINNTLSGILMYHKPPYSDTYIVNHLRVDYSYPYIFDYLTHAFAKMADEENIPRMNFEMDLGIEGLRRHKVALRPVEMLKQFTVKRKNLENAE